MVLDRETFKQRLQQEQDTEYLQALYSMAAMVSEQWVVDDLRSEINSRAPSTE